jgi:dihydrofolate synthase/folylpolyglutamate synthase
VSGAAPPTGSPLESWLDFIGGQHPSAIDLGLDRPREVEGRMHLARPPVVITVGGTNGKGSTTALLESILRVAGYRTGLYTSPHLVRYNERVRLDGEEASDADLVAGFEAVESARGAVPLTYFEFGTLAAFEIFARRQVEVAVLEVGLGGRLDCVNLLDADAAIVVSVDLDHQDWLGDTREAIGFEKAHIYRAGRPAIYGEASMPGTVEAHARAIGAHLQALGRDYRFVRHEGQWDFEGRRGAKRALPMPALRGPWQLANASAALAALDELSGRLPVSIGEVKRGLTGVRLPGRLQVLPGRPSVVLDVAHNPHAARALGEGLAGMGYARETIAVFAMLGDKDIEGVIAAMAPRVDRWHVATVASERAASVERVAGLLAARGLGERVRRFASVPLAYEAALREAGPDDRILVFGSFLTVADVLRLPR